MAQAERRRPRRQPRYIVPRARPFNRLAQLSERIKQAKEELRPTMMATLAYELAQAHRRLYTQEAASSPQPPARKAIARAYALGRKHGYYVGFAVGLVSGSVIGVVIGVWAISLKLYHEIIG